MKDIAKIMLDPTRMRIVQAFTSARTLTTQDLCRMLPDVPRTTLYRHIKILLGGGVLLVESERRVRGSLERTLALDVAGIKSRNDTDDPAGDAFAFFMNKYIALRDYFAGGDADPGADRVFLNNTVLMANDAEFDEFLSKLRELLVDYNFEYAKGRRARDISIVSAPERRRGNED